MEYDSLSMHAMHSSFGLPSTFYRLRELSCHGYREYAERSTAIFRKLRIRWEKINCVYIIVESTKSASIGCYEEQRGLGHCDIAFYGAKGLEKHRAPQVWKNRTK